MLNCQRVMSRKQWTSKAQQLWNDVYCLAIFLVSGMLGSNFKLKIHGHPTTIRNSCITGFFLPLMSGYIHIYIYIYLSIYLSIFIHMYTYSIWIGISWPYGIKVSTEVPFQAAKGILWAATWQLILKVTRKRGIKRWSNSYGEMNHIWYDMILIYIYYILYIWYIAIPP